MVELNADSRIQRVENIASATINGEVINLNPYNGQYYSLNEVSALLWENLEAPNDMMSLCELVMAEYEVDLETCMRDVQGFIQEMIDAGMLEVIDGGLHS